MSKNYNKFFQKNGKENENLIADKKEEVLEAETISENVDKKADSLYEAYNSASKIIGVDLGHIEKDVEGTIPEDPISDSKEPPKEPVHATIINCKLLNLRERPTKDSLVICVLGADETLLIDDKQPEWAHVYTSSGFEGFVMRKFIKENA